MRRIAVLAVVVLAGCSSSGGASVPDTQPVASGFDVDAAKEAWLAEVAPFVPDGPTLDAAIDSVERGCLAEDEVAARTAEVSYAMSQQSGSAGPIDAAMEAGCAELPEWFVAAQG